MRIEEDLLMDILDAIAAIEKYTSPEMENSESEELIQVWVLHHLQIIGEACGAMPQNFKDKNPSIPWKGIIGMRNILVHHYFSIDPELVREMVQRDIPVLKEKIMISLQNK